MLSEYVKTGSFTLSSGKKSNYYINIKEACTSPDVLKEIAIEMSKFVKKEEVDRIAGIALGGVPIAVALGLKLDIPFLMVRGDKKGHGTLARIEGAFKKGDRVIMVEDVVTTGGSVMAGVKEIRKKGVCKKVLSVVDRKEGALELLRKHDVELTSLISARVLFGGD